MLSAFDFSETTISATTVGDVLTILQSSISPPEGNIADSMSAAVVPGAKFSPQTVKGPDAEPRILISSVLSCVSDLPFVVGCRSVAVRLS